ncbi:MAG: hypothetical protein FWE16_04005 [Firmicutes bacterium]|nr:hypothetical protein [Bacillota bacterium]
MDNKETLINRFRYKAWSALRNIVGLEDFASLEPKSEEPEMIDFDFYHEKYGKPNDGVQPDGPPKPVVDFDEYRKRMAEPMPLEPLCQVDDFIQFVKDDQARRAPRLERLDIELRKLERKARFDDMINQTKDI